MVWWILSDRTHTQFTRAQTHSRNEGRSVAAATLPVPTFLNSVKSLLVTVSGYALIP